MSLLALRFFQKASNPTHLSGTTKDRFCRWIYCSQQVSPTHYLSTSVKQLKAFEDNINIDLNRLRRCMLLGMRRRTLLREGFAERENLRTLPQKHRRFFRYRQQLHEHCSLILQLTCSGQLCFAARFALLRRVACFHRQVHPITRITAYLALLGNLLLLKLEILRYFQECLL